jgi:4-carboxymuconolactone decarboxylase
MAEMRLPAFKPQDLDAGQRDLYDAFVSGPRQSQAQFFPVVDDAGVLSGPYNAMLLSPAVGSPLERLGRAVRYETQLPARVRELVILTVAALTESEVEWQAHEALALSVGVPHTTVSTLRTEAPSLSDRVDELVHTFVHQLLDRHDVEDRTFADVTAEFGLPGVLELVATAGYYQVVAHMNNAFALRPRDDSAAS